MVQRPALPNNGNDGAVDSNGSEEQDANNSDEPTCKEDIMEGSTQIIGPPPPFETLLSPDLCQVLLRPGWGTKVPYKKDSSVAQEDYSKLFDADGYYKGNDFAVSGEWKSDDKPIEDVHIENDKSAAHDTSIEDVLMTSLYDTGTPTRIEAIEENDCLDYGEGTGRDDESDKKVKQGVKNWAYVNFSGMSDKETSRFLHKLIKMCVSIGMDFFPMPTRSAHVNSYLPMDIEKALVVMNFHLARYFIRSDSGVDGNHIGLLIVFLPDCPHSHEKVEEVCRSLGFVYQCFSSRDARSLNQERMRMAAHEINEKVIQRHHTGVQRPLVCADIPFVSEAPTVIFGADISRSAPGEGPISIASVVASMDWPGANKHRALVSYQPHTELAMKDLFNLEKENGGIFSELMLAFHKNTEEWPQRIIFFRNGETGGQLRDTYRCEMHYIKNACSRLSMGHIPLVTFVIVAERPSNESQGMCDVASGSELGEDGFIHINFEFSPGFSREGTPMRYCVLHDENCFTPDQFASLCSNLRTRHIRWTYPGISTGTVPSSYFAQDAAFLARKYAENYFRYTSTAPKELPEYVIP